MYMVAQGTTGDHIKLSKTMYNPSKTGCKIATGYVRPRRTSRSKNF